MKNGWWFLPLAATLAAAADLPRPTPAQLEWQRMELTMFCHFGVNTFTDREWGEGREDPAIFNPAALDCGAWAAAAKDAGFKLAILTAKHHDGFCLWPSKHTDHCVKRSPWKNGAGDVVREFTDAFRAAGLKVGLYLSPWDRHEPTYGTDAYNDHFCNQLTELLTQYGTVDEVWFDGACGEGPNGKKQVYDWPRYFALIRRLQPGALIAISGPDIRWVGNESGVARVGESSVQPPLSTPHDGPRQWRPAECDVSIRPGWFYHAAEDAKVKTTAKLMDIYFKSVGRNSVLLLNVPPDRRGLFSDADVTRLKEFGAAVRALYATTVGSASGPAPVAEFGSEQAFNLVNVREDIAQGERVQDYRIEAHSGGAWRTVARGTVIGNRNLHRLRETRADAVRVAVDRSLDTPAVTLSVHRAADLGEWAGGSLAAHKPATASNVHPGGTQYGADKAVDDDPDTRWATSDETRACWLEVDLGAEETIGAIGIRELQPRVRRFAIETRTGEDAPWAVAFEGGAAGTNYSTNCAPFRARRVRLNILEASAPPTIWEFALLPPAKP